MMRNLCPATPGAFKPIRARIAALAGNSALQSDRLKICLKPGSVR